MVAGLPIEEAGRFLIELANLRGGPDNITVLIVRVGRESRFGCRRQPGIFHKLKAICNRFGAAWTRSVPWPISILIVGFLLAVSFVLCAANGWTSGATIFLATAIISILIGLAGLWVYSRRQAAAPVVVPDAPTRASVYRQYPIRVDAGLIDRWTKTCLQLKEQLKARVGRRLAGLQARRRRGRQTCGGR